MGQELGRAALRRIFWASLIVLFDIRIQGFDLLVDPVGYLMLADAAFRLSLHERAFRVVQRSAYVLALFSVAEIIRSMRATAGTVSPTAATDVFWSQPGNAEVPLQTGVSPALLLSAVGTVAGWILVWFLLGGVAAIAKSDGLAEFADRTESTRRLLVGALVVSDTLAWILFAAGALDATFAVVLIVGVVALVLGIMGLKAVWDGSADLLFIDPDIETDEMNQAPVGPPVGVMWLALAAGIGSIFLAVVEEPFDANDPVAIAAALQPPGLTYPAVLEVDTTDPDRFNEFPDQDRCVAASGLTSVDLVSGELLWTYEIPRQMAGRLMESDGLVFIVDDRTGSRLPPSVAAIDPRSGLVEWQYFFEAAQARFYGRSNDRVAVSVGDFSGLGDGQVVVLDRFGNVVDEFADPTTETSILTDQDPGYELWPAFSVSSWHFMPSDLPPESRMHMITSEPGADGSQAVVTWFSDRRLGHFNRVTGEVTMAEPVGPTSVYDQLGNPHSPGRAVQHNEHQTMVLLGSDQGPNSRLSIFDPATGTKRWETEHIRSAALAGPHVLYDKRDDSADETDLVTRTLYLVNGNDPDEVIWSTALSVNAAGGNGYLGSVTGIDGMEQLVFVVRQHEEVDLDGEDDIRFIKLDATADTQAVPEILMAGGLLGGGPTPLSHVDDHLVVAAGRTSVTWQRSTGSIQRVDLADERGATSIRSLVVVDDMLLVEHACDW